MEKLSFPQLSQKKFSFKKKEFITSSEDWGDADDGSQFEDIILTPQPSDIEKPQPKWKLTKRYVNEYRNSCNVESCPCDSKPSEECITHMKSIRML